MSFSQEVKIQAMVSCGRSCCICHRFRGNNMEVHHIKQRADGGEDTLENAIPLCFDCHAEVGQYNKHHSKGIKFSEKELILHRDNWYDKVKNNTILPSPQTKEIDIVTYNKLKEHLPKSLLLFVKDIDFRCDYYESGQLRPLEQFGNACNDPMLEYLDKDLEVAKSMLKSSIVQFLSDSFSCVFCDDGVKCMIPKEWKYKDEKLYYSNIELLNKSTLQIWESYCDYIKMCRRKLEITGE